MILEGDCLDKLKELDNDSIDLVCTDPPYGYSFMSKDWDKAVPSVEIWEECLRVLKPGAFCMVMSAPRSDVQVHMIQNLTEAGFRLDFTPIYWTYASGFPKAGNIGKLVDKRLGAEREVIGRKDGERYAYEFNHGANGGKIGEGDAGTITAPATLQAKALDGSYAGFQPKPAVEVIIVAMKPLSEKTFVDQALKNGKGITWLDDCRIPTETGRPISSHNSHNRQSSNEGWKRPSTTTGESPTYKMNSGRFPANLLISDSILDTICTCITEENTQTQPRGSNLAEGGIKDSQKPMEMSLFTENLEAKKQNERLQPNSKGEHSQTSTERTLQGQEKNGLTASDVSHLEPTDETDTISTGERLYSNEITTNVSSVATKAQTEKESISRLTTSKLGQHTNNYDTKSAMDEPCALHATGTPRHGAIKSNTSQYSRYFDLDKWANTLPFLIVPKASKREKNEGLDNDAQMPWQEAQGGNMKGGKNRLNGSGQPAKPTLHKNHHPTVKPLKLMSYLITLGSRPGDTVLDPFCGSGTTCLAAKKLNREYIGIEKEAEYAEIANARLKVKVQGSFL